MAHKFIILLDGELKEYTNYDDIPESFDNVIEFKPELPPAPHSAEQHEEMESWLFKFKELMKRETK